MSAQPDRRAFAVGRAGALVVSLVLLWLVFRRIDLVALQQAFGRLHLGWYALTLAAFGLATVLAACRWHLMLRLTGCTVHPAASFRAVLIGHFFNTLLLGPAGGDVAKSALYGRWYRHPMPDVLAAAFLDRLLGAGGSVLLGLLTLGLAAASGALDVLSQLDLPRARWLMVIGVALVALAGAVMWRRPWKPDSALGRAVDALTGGLRKLAAAPAVMFQGWLLGLLVQTCWCGLLALSLKSVAHEPLPWGALIWTFPVIGMAASAPVTFAGAGVREGTALFLLGLYGVARTDAVAAAMLTLLAYFLWAALGGWLLWREERWFSRRRSTEVAPMISVVIPVLNEAQALPETVKHLRAIPEIGEIIVVDGGSRDGTCEVARHLRCSVVSAPPGRGGQMRRGVALAQGDIVMLVHADTWLPPAAGQAVMRALRDGTVVGGGFWKVFREPSWLMRGSRWRCAWRLLVAGRVAGDQAMFVRRDALAGVGGVPEMPLMEEFELCRRLRQAGRLVLAGATVSTSARRFAKLGPLRTYARMWRITFLYWLGIEPQVLQRLYEKE